MIPISTSAKLSSEQQALAASCIALARKLANRFAATNRDLDAVEIHGAAMLALCRAALSGHRRSG